MRTRRSPRNQERLYRALAGQTTRPASTPAVEVLTHLLARTDMRPRVRRQLQQDLERERNRLAARKE